MKRGQKIETGAFEAVGSVEVGIVSGMVDGEAGGEAGATTGEVTLKDGERVRLRPAVPDDAERLLDLLRPIIAEHEYLANDGHFTVEEERQFIASRAQGGRALLLLAEDGRGRIVGSCGIGPVEEDRLASMFHVARAGIALHREYRGRGLGRAALTAGIEWARQAGYKKVEAEAFATNVRSLALFDRLGFEREAVLRGHACLDGRDVDSVLLARFLVDPASMPSVVWTPAPAGDGVRARPALPCGDPPPLPFAMALGDGRGVVVRVATPDDAVGLCATMRVIGREGGFPWDRFPFTVDDVRRQLADETADDGGLTLVPEVDGRIAGRVRGSRFQSGRLPKYRHVLWVGTALRRDLRGQGLGQVMVSVLLRWGEERGYRRAYAIAFADNSASRGMFRALGFREEGAQRRRVFLRGQYIDDVSLGLIIPEARRERGGFLPAGRYRFETTDDGGDANDGA